MTGGDCTTMDIVSLILFILALIHTFSTKYFDKLADNAKTPCKGGIFRMLSEVEVVFGFWALVLVVWMMSYHGQSKTISHLDSLHFKEPIFVFVIMIIAATKPIILFVQTVVAKLSSMMPWNTSLSIYFLTLSLVPLSGSLITEPAAMTLSAFMLKEHFFNEKSSEKLKYLTLAVLFVNVSIGGTMTNFVAPAVIMIADKWDWSSWFMFQNFGYKAALAVFLNAILVTSFLKSEIVKINVIQQQKDKPFLWITLVHFAFLGLVIWFAEHTILFVGVFLFFLGITHACKKYQGTLILKEALLVAFFLSGLVILGSQQSWWIQPLLLSMDETTAFWGAVLMTSITDNAALTYLASLVDGLSLEFKTSLVSGAVVGGGLTVIANAPNPAGASILKERFASKSISFFYLFIAALPPTGIAALIFRLL